MRYNSHFYLLETKFDTADAIAIRIFWVSSGKKARLRSSPFLLLRTENILNTKSENRTWQKTKVIFFGSKFGQAWSWQRQNNVCYPHMIYDNTSDTYMNTWNSVYCDSYGIVVVIVCIHALFRNAVFGKCMAECWIFMKSVDIISWSMYDCGDESANWQSSIAMDSMHI